MQKRPFVCRNCGSICPIIVSVEGNRVVKVEGDFEAPLYRGYTCAKGRMLPAEHHNPNRLLHSLKKMPDGSFAPISSADLVGEIAGRLSSILKEHGPNAVATFLGNGVSSQPAASGLMLSFLAAIGSPMMFSNGTLDQPGLSIALGLHGGWQGGRVHPQQWQAKLLVGGNPVVSKQHLPQNPAWQLKELQQRGVKFIVIDPRRTETARRAAVHLQPVAGEDPTILAGLIHLIFALGGVDQEFTTQNAEGVEKLRDAVAGFTPEYVAARAGLAKQDLIAAAQTIIAAESGDTALGVGPSMATRGILTSYLALCIQTLRGWWAKEGAPVSRPKVLSARRDWRAQPLPPSPGWGFGVKLPTKRGLQQTIAGMPTAALPELMLAEDETRIRTLFSHAGIYYTWPETNKVVKALSNLDLFVTHDTQLSATARFADYVIATYDQLETPAMSQFNETVGDIHPGYDWNEPYGFYRDPAVAPPENSDLMESWQVYYRVAKALDLPLNYFNFSFVGGVTVAGPMDMRHEPATTDLYAQICEGSAVPLEEVKQHPHGAIFESAREWVKPSDPHCTAKLQLADPDMLAELAEVLAENPLSRRKTSADYPFQLISRRMQNSTSSLPRPEGIIKTGYNPLFMHPDDMEKLGVPDGGGVKIRSRFGAIEGFAEADETMRPGIVAMTFGFGRRPGNGGPRQDGSNVNELLSWDDDPDPYHGMPRMSAVPVAVHAV